MSITLRLLLLFLFFISVVHSTPKNPLIAPKAKEVIPVDIPYTIRWIPQTSGPVYIQLLYDDNVKATNITASTSNTGSYSWTPVGVFAGRDNYFLAICDLNPSQGDCSYTYNGRFAIASSSSSTSSTFEATSSFSSSSASPTSLSSSFTSTSSTSALSSSTQTSTPNSTLDPPSGLSTGAKAAIGVVVPIVGIAIAVLAFFLIRKRGKARQPAALNTDPGHEIAPVSEYRKAELPGESNHANRVELPGDQRTGD